MSETETVFVVNPRAGNGSCGAAWPATEALARKKLGAFASLITGAQGDARDMAEKAAAAGVKRIVCVGGDGTLNEVINGLMAAGAARSKSLNLGLVPSGTGCDLIRTVPIPPDSAAAIDAIAAGRTRPLDVGRIFFKDHAGACRCRYFHNLASFGLGGEVAERVNRTSKACGPFFSFILATLITIVRYGRKRVFLQIDGRPMGAYTVLNIAVANGQYHGGGMRVAPEARVDDGLLHLTVIGDLSLPEVFVNLPRLYNGQITRCRKVKTFTGRRVEAVSMQQVLLDVDGEQPGSLPAAFDLLPGALNVLTA